MMVLNKVQYYLSAIHLIIFIISCVQGTPERELTPAYWRNMGNADIKEAMETYNNLNTNVAKNVILFVGDGMSLGTMVVGRILKGQRNKGPMDDDVRGEETMTTLDKMPHLGLLKTYSVDKQSPDGAATATAILCGVKTKSMRVGVTARAKANRCASVKGNELESILMMSAKEGKYTGIVTTSIVQDAVVAASYANVPNRKWVSDKFIPESEKACKDISAQLIEMGSDINVILGGGRVHMRPAGTSDEEYGSISKKGNRRDGRDLIKEWINDKPRQSSRYVWNKEEFDDVVPKETDHLLGLFEPFNMKYKLDKRESKKHDEPSLPEMTRKAIQILQKNKNGFFLLVDGSLIDRGHHKSKPQYALEEFLEFENALKVAKSMTSEEDTLIMVTADHGTLLNYGGGTTVRGNPVLGLSADDNNPKRGTDGKHYTSILYGNGPGRRGDQKDIRSLNLAETFHSNYTYQSVVPMKSGSHSAEDVIALASGPMSHLVHGVHEQSYLAHVMMYASCVECAIVMNDILEALLYDILNGVKGPFTILGFLEFLQLFYSPHSIQMLFKYV